jgi:type IV pilus assembly protein PilC
MVRWNWQGMDRHGHWCRGCDPAVSKQALAEQLREEGVALIYCRRSWWRRQQPKTTDVMWFLRQWATLLEAGVPLVGSLDVMMADRRSRTLGVVAASLCRQLESGHPLSQALARHDCFEPGLRLAVAAGEETGHLAQSLELWSGLQEKKRRLRQRARSALLYPGLVLAMALLMLVVMLWAVVPAFASIFAAAGRELPLATRVILLLSELLRENGEEGLVGLMGVFGMQFGLRRSHRVRVLLERLLLRLPLIGPVLRQAGLARWARTLSMLLASGVPLADAIRPASQNSGNALLAAAAGPISRQLQSGMPLADALQASGLFSPLLLQLVRVGEASGALDHLCERVAEHLEQETEQSFLSLTAMLEPVAMGVLGALCAFLLWALYLPIFQLGEVIA